MQFDALEWSILKYSLNEMIKLELSQPACTCTFLKRNPVSLLKDIISGQFFHLLYENMANNFLFPL